jgi:hypothetical protein
VSSPVKFFHHSLMFVDKAKNTFVFGDYGR